MLVISDPDITCTRAADDKTVPGKPFADISIANAINGAANK